jgi:phytoene dehydrogenase-like protein
VENLERRVACIAWYGWALHELPNYTVAGTNPDLNQAVSLGLISKDPEALVREDAVRKLGKMPEELFLAVFPQATEDMSRAPEGKWTAYTEQFVPPANVLTETEWLEFKKSHADAVIREWQKYAPNMTWDNVIGYTPFTPYDACHLANMAPTGNTGVIDRNIMSQLGRCRPIPELARHRTPVKDLYATGSAWHPHGNGGCWQGYNCYKIIADDFGLEKPWEGHPW